MQSPLLWLCIECSANLFEGMILISFFNAFLPRRLNRKWIYWLLPILQAGSTYVINQLPVDVITGVLLSVAVGIVIVLCCYRGSVLQRIFLTVAFFSVWMASEFAILSLLNLIFKDFFTHLMQPSIERLTSILVCKLGLFLLLKLVVQFAPASRERLPLQRVIPLFSLPIVSLLLVFNMQIFWKEQSDSRLFAITAISTIGLLFANLIVFDQYSRLQRDERLHHQDQMIEQHLLSEKKRLALLDEKQRELLLLSHDLKNSLVPVTVALNLDDVELAKKFLEKMIGQLSVESIERYTGHALLDTILSQKQKTARERGIQILIRADLPETLRIDIVDLSVILGNALDNALEAADLLPPTDRKVITLEIKHEGEYLILTIGNPTATQLQTRDGLFPSTKSEAGRHGYGLTSIRQLAEKYSGSTQIDVSNQTFILKIFLYNKEAVC